MNEVAAEKSHAVVQVSTKQVELIKRTVAKGATNDELQMFLHLAQAYNLDPFAKEIWFIKRVKKTKNKIDDTWDYPRLPNGEIDYSNAEAPVIMTSRDGYLKIAQRDEKFDGLISFPVREGDNFEIDAMNYTVTHKFGAKRGHILGAWAKCERKDCKPMIAFVDFAEYNDANSPVWKKYPSAMIQKVAEVFVLKRQFGISGLTTKEEMPEEYDIKNVSEHQVSSLSQPAVNNVPQIPQNVGDYEVSINNSPRRKLSEMTMKQLKWLAQGAKSETTRAMTIAYIDEIEFKGKEIEAETHSPAGQNLTASSFHTDEVQEDNPMALFGGAAL